MRLAPDDIAALKLTLSLASLATVILIVLGAPVAWWLSRSRSRLKALVEAAVSLPLVLPPTVLGFYLLVLLGPQGPLGRLIVEAGGSSPVFRFEGLVIGSIVYSLPFVIRPLQATFEAIDEGLIEAAATLGAGPLDRFFGVVMPVSRGGFLTAAVLGFAHTLGEFGVVLMLGGNIPGQTRVVSIAIYDHVEALRYDQAHGLAGLLLLVSFSLLMVVFVTNRQSRTGVL